MVRILPRAEAHPAFVRSMLRSMHFQQKCVRRPITMEGLIDRYGLASDRGRMERTYEACRDLGALQEDANGLVTLSEDWALVVGPESHPQDFGLKISSALESFEDLYELCRGLLATPVLGPKRDLDEWRHAWPGPAKSAPFGPDDTQRNNAQFWMQYLGWVRRFGKRHFVPDFTHWLEAWLQQVKPRGARCVLREVWNAWCQALPPLRDVDLETGIPEAMGVALDAIARRKHARFFDEADSSELTLQWQVGDARRSFRFIEWLDRGGES